MLVVTCPHPLRFLLIFLEAPPVAFGAFYISWPVSAILGGTGSERPWGGLGFTSSLPRTSGASVESTRDLWKIGKPRSLSYNCETISGGMQGPEFSGGNRLRLTWKEFSHLLTSPFLATLPWSLGQAKGTPDAPQRDQRDAKYRPPLLDTLLLPGTLGVQVSAYAWSHFKPMTSATSVLNVTLFFSLYSTPISQLQTPPLRTLLSSPLYGK